MAAADQGPVPDNAKPREGRQTNGALWPDFVSTLARDSVTVAGYVPKAYLLDGGPLTPAIRPARRHARNRSTAKT